MEQEVGHQSFKASIKECIKIVEEIHELKNQLKELRQRQQDYESQIRKYMEEHEMTRLKMSEKYYISLDVRSKKKPINKTSIKDCLIYHNLADNQADEIVKMLYQNDDAEKLKRICFKKLM